MKYQDLKIRDAGRLALAALGMTILVAVGYVAGNAAPNMADKYFALLVGLAAVCPLCIATCLYYMFSSPAHNARVIRWGERHRWGGPPLNFDWTLLDASDPDYNTPTIQYLLAKRAARKGD